MNESGHKPILISVQPPADVPEYAWPAWHSCLLWAIYSPEIRAAFTANSGLQYNFPQSRMEALVDESCGFDPAEKFILAFVPWFNATIWGAWDKNKNY